MHRVRVLCIGAGVGVPDRADVRAPVQVPDDCAPVCGPAHRDAPRARGRDGDDGRGVCAQNVRERGVRAGEAPEAHGVVTRARDEVLRVGERRACAVRRFDHLHDLWLISGSKHVSGWVGTHLVVDEHAEVACAADAGSARAPFDLLVRPRRGTERVRWAWDDALADRI